MDEFVVVLCSDGADLPVWIDDEVNGWTGETQVVQRGTHGFALCECRGDEHEPGCAAEGYRPVEQKAEVQNTISVDPLEVTFERV